MNVINFKNELEKRNMTPYRFSKNLGIPYSTVWRWFNGTKISPAYFKLLASYFTINT